MEQYFIVSVLVKKLSKTHTQIQIVDLRKKDPLYLLTRGKNLNLSS